MGGSSSLLLVGALLAALIFWSFLNYRKGIARVGSTKVHRDTDPTWFKIYNAINVIVLGGGAVLLIVLLIKSLS